jgi:oligoendopeptidase F
MKKTAKKPAKTDASRPEWNLAKFYSSPSDPRLESDFAAIEGRCEAFRTAWYGKILPDMPRTELAAALSDHERMSIELGNAKSLHWLHLWLSKDSGNDAASAKSNLLTARAGKIVSRVIFFELALGKFPSNVQRELLSDTKLSHWHRYMGLLFERSRHDLTEAEERIINLKHGPARGQWVDGFSKLLGKQTVRHAGKDMPLSGAAFLLPDLPRPARVKLHAAIVEKSKSISDFAESEMNAIITDKKIDDELRGFEKPYSAMLLSTQNSEAEIMSLLKAAQDGAHIAERFYGLKKKILGLKKLAWHDRGASIGKVKSKITFADAHKLVGGILGGVNPEYSKYLDEMVAGGLIDAYPAKGKRGGAFCSSSLFLPTFILLNHVDTPDSATTLAHEFGHATHSKFTQENQPPLYADYTLSVAEVASTLFERFVFDALYERADDKEKIVLLHDRIVDDISSTFTQAAAFAFEKELHEKVRAEGFVPKEEIAKMIVRHMGTFGGKHVDLKDDDGYFFVRWGHIRVFFYNYQYAYGALVSKALHRGYKKDKAYLAKIEAFLKAGTSLPPRDIFRAAGIDTEDPDFFREGIRSIEEDVDKLEKLLKARVRR